MASPGDLEPGDTESQVDNNALLLRTIASYMVKEGRWVIIQDYLFSHTLTSAIFLLQMHIHMCKLNMLEMCVWSVVCILGILNFHVSLWYFVIKYICFCNSS